MAQVFQRNDVWYARFMHNGKDYSRSTRVAVASGSRKAGSKAKASEELARMLAEIRGRESVDALFARLTEALDRLPRSEQEPKRLMLSERIRSGVTAHLSINDTWQAWLDNPKKRNPSQATIEMYHAYWGRDEIKKHGRQKVKNGFKNWLSKAYPEVSALHEISPAIAEEYATHLWQSGVSPRTYNGAIKFLRSMFKTLSTRGGLLVNVWEEITAQDGETEGRRKLKDRELRKVCAKAEGDLRYWLAIGMYSGLRLADVICLKWDGGEHVEKGESYRLGVRFDEHCIRIVPHKTRRKGKMVSVPLHPVLEALLMELRASTDASAEYLFPEAAMRHGKGQSSAITKQIQDHFTACGIQTTEEPTGPHRKKAIVRVGFHSLRHSFVSMCAAKGVQRAVVQELVGHGSPAMTALYEHADEEQKAEAIAQLPTVKFAQV